MNRILKKIAEDNSEKQQIIDGLKDLGFRFCTTGGNCTAYYKELGDNKTMYVVDDSGIDLPAKLDEGFMVTILDNENTDEETEQAAFFNGYDDFIDNYMDMSKYEDIV